MAVFSITYHSSSKVLWFMNQIAAIIKLPEQEKFENSESKLILYDQASDSSWSKNRIPIFKSNIYPFKYFSNIVVS